MSPMLRLPAGALALVVASSAAQAGIVGFGQNPPPLPLCPLAGLSWACIIDQAARAEGPVTGFEAIRVGRTAGYANMASLQVGEFASLTLNSTQTSANLIVGDNVGAAAALEVTRGGSITINVPTNGAGSGGLIVGPFAAPGDAPQGLGGVPVPSTTMVISDGGSVVVNKPGGANVGAAVGIGYGVGSRSALVMDGGIGGFGVPANPVSLSTSGNISIGREGAGSLSLFRHATVQAGIVYMSAISATGASSLDLYFQSTLTGSVFAGIALDTATGRIDAGSHAHGTAVVSVAETSTLDGTLTLGEGGTLYGTGHVGGVSSFGGMVRPGFSPGTLHIDHDYTDVGGTLVLEIGPAASDFLDVMGKLAFDGTTIEFAFVDGFAPQAGFTYAFLQAQDPDIEPDVAMHDVHYRFSGLQPGFAFTVVVDPLTGEGRFTAVNDGVAISEPTGTALAGVALAAAWMARRRRR